MNEKVSAYIGKVKNWQAEMKALRAMLIEFPLTEELN